MPTVVVLLPSTTYRAEDFLEAAVSLDVDVIVASDVAPPIEMGDGYVQVDCRDPGQAAMDIVALNDRVDVDGIVAADDGGVVTAAIAASNLGIPGNPATAATATRDKATQRSLLASAEVPQPRFRLLSPGDPIPHGIDFPAVVKPTDRSAGQGVLRVEDPTQLTAAIRQVRGIVGDEATLLLEEFVPGAEIAIEGLVSRGALTTLAVFDKPYATHGPAFPETILVTPSELEATTINEAQRVADLAVRALGLTHGPVHVELKVEGGRAKVIEVAARSIGGLCSRSLSFGLMNTSLETLILRNALGMDKPELQRENTASGVLMIPIPRAGTYRGLANEAVIRGIEHVTGIEISARPGDRLEPPPWGDRYLGFVFARASIPGQVTAALRRAQQLIEVDMA